MSSENLRDDIRNLIQQFKLKDNYERNCYYYLILKFKREHVANFTSFTQDGFLYKTGLNHNKMSVLIVNCCTLRTTI